MRRPFALAAALVPVLLAGCGRPLTSVQVEVPELRMTLTGSFPAVPVDASSFCSGSPPPTDCGARDVSYDLSSEVPMLDEKDVDVDLHLGDMAIRLLSGNPTDLSGIR